MLRIGKIAMFWFWVALAIRIFIASVLHIYSYAAGLGGFSPIASLADDSGYYYTAVGIYDRVATPLMIANAYPGVIATFFELTGSSIPAAKFLNVLAGALTVYLGVLIAQTLTEGDTATLRKRAMHWAGALLCFYPSALFYSTQILKDAILIMLGMWALYLEIRMLRRPQIMHIVLLVGAFAALFLFRGYAALILALSVVVFSFRWRRRWLIPLIILTAVVPYMAGLGWFGLTYIGPWLDVNRIDRFRESAYSIGGSAAGIRVDYSNPFIFVATYTYSFATAMFGPFPWQISSIVHIIALPETILMWLLIPLWIKGLKSLFRERRRLDRRATLVMLSSLALIAAVALFSDNIGANTRLRMLSWSAFFVYAALRMPALRWSPSPVRTPQIPMVRQG